MIRHCAWCDTTLGEAAPLEDRTITHGICMSCAAALLASTNRLDDSKLIPFSQPFVLHSGMFPPVQRLVFTG
jgi:hypothetical protein